MNTYRKKLIFAVSKFRGLMKMTYWRRLIFASVFTLAPNKKFLYKLVTFFSVTVYIVKLYIC